MAAYIEIVNDYMVQFARELTPEDLKEIGEFTRENVHKWLNSPTHTGPEWIEIIPEDDFHAVCGEIDIAWATDKARQSFKHAQEHVRKSYEELRKRFDKTA